MKKTLLIISLIIFSLGAFAQSANKGTEGVNTQNSNLRFDPNPVVEITFENIKADSVDVVFTPNATCGEYTILINKTSEGVPTEVFLSFFGLLKTGNCTHTFKLLDPNTEYTVYVLPKDLSSTIFPIQSASFITLSIGGAGTSELTIVVSDIAATQARVIVTPNAETSVYQYGLITKNYYDQIGADSALNYFKADPYLFYYEDNWTWPELTPNTDYYVVAIGQNIIDEWGTPNIFPFKTLNLGGTGLSTLTIEVSEIADTLTRVTVTPNAETSVFFDIIISLEEYNQIGADSTLKLLKSNPRKLYVTDNSVWTGLAPNTDYFAMAIGQNINDEWGTIISVPFKTLSPAGITTVEKNSALAAISPNPNNGKFNIELNSSEVVEVQIFDLNGRVVYKQTINNALQSVNVEHLDNGCYFVQLISNSGVRQQVQKIVISK